MIFVQNGIFIQYINTRKKIRRTKSKETCAGCQNNVPISTFYSAQPPAKGILSILIAVTLRRAQEIKPLPLELKMKFHTMDWGIEGWKVL
jgi:hypothetical protein